MADEEKPTLKTLALQWVLTQGVSTVLLFAILLVIAYGVPWTYTEFKAWHSTSEEARRVERVAAQKLDSEERIKASDLATKRVEILAASFDKHAVAIEKMANESSKVAAEVKELTATIKAEVKKP